jgi:glutamate N-acetyltransferase/amino-acid N-acetyltransferase
MAVGKGDLPALEPVAGFQLGVASAGIKKPGRLDLVVMALCEGSTVAAMFTRNAFCAAPIQLARAHLQQQPNSRYLLVNTGNANAGTGDAGRKNAELCCQTLAELTGCAKQDVLPFSTGVIGEPLPVSKIQAALPQALDDLGESGWERAARGIMTTDTRPKAASRKILVNGQAVVITGIAKGAGMIKPNMATMLAYLATDAAVEQQTLQSILQQAVNCSFNRITIDGDTSTNDACTLVATGASGVSCDAGEACQQLTDAVTELAIELAQGLVKDGEGASKFVTVKVSGGKSHSECLKVAYTIAESPLVKTALFASDPNWGRLLAAIGRAGVENLDVNKVSVFINDILIAEKGCRADSYSEEQGVLAMQCEEIAISIDLGRGEEVATVWTSDLSDEYVRINAEYRS